MNHLSIILFILIIPGILSTIIIENLTIHKRTNSFFFTLYSLLIGFLSYSLLQLLQNVWIFVRNFICEKYTPYTSLNAWGIISQSDQYSVNLTEVVFATLVAIPLGFLIAALIHHKVVNKIAKAISASSKYGDENLFYYYLNSKEIDWVYIRDKENEQIYQGKVESYSENEKIHEIVLTDVTVFSYYDPKEIYKTPTMYICKELGKLQIEQIPNENFNPKKEITNGKN